MKETTGKVISLSMYLNCDRIEVEIMPNDGSGVKRFCMNGKNDHIAETSVLMLSKKTDCDITISYSEVPSAPFLISVISMK